VIKAPAGHQETPIHMMTQKEYEESISKTHIRVRFVKLPDGLQIILIYANPENI